MAFKVKIKNNLEGLKQLIPDVKREFKRSNSVSKIQKEILDDIRAGVSPVKGAGKFKKYSTSYKEQIRGRLSFFTVGTGPSRKVIPIKGSGLTTKPVRDGKSISPINLTSSGKFLKTFSVKAIGSFRRRGAFKLRFQFNSPLADIHNRLGAAGKTVRRILPTESGERFNRRISTLILDELRKAVKVVTDKNK